MRLSAIDILSPNHIRALIPALDQLGYHRFWSTEHHSPFQSGSPIVMAAIAAGLSRRMRVGTAGVMLKLRNPYRVAEEIRLLENMFPGRIDLGLIGAVPKEPICANLLDGRTAVDESGYGKKIIELIKFLRPSQEDQTDSHHFPGPNILRAPELWLCGTSRNTAQMAAMLGLSFAYHDHDYGRDGTPIQGPSIVEEYRASFRSFHPGDKPKVAVICYGLCAETNNKAIDNWFPAIGLPPNFIGDPSQCRSQLKEIEDRYSCGELVIQSVAKDVDARLISYALLKEIC